ncbi:MAG TPA: hypothetical protein PK984_05375 [Paludibacteraceae bacterium]|nr:hypothetical protein [Paludibacteraceae bacterium]HOS37623.1 hypothetical protein [Paludibacteraceae bacterium]
MKKIFLFVGICGLLLACEKPEPQKQEFVGSYDVTTTGTLYLTDDSIPIPEYSQSILIEQFNKDSLIISYEDTIQKPFKAKINSITTFSYEAPFNMDFDIFVLSADLIGTRNGEGIQINKDSIVMNDSITNGTFEIIYRITGDTLRGTFNGTLQHRAKRK